MRCTKTYIPKAQRLGKQIFELCQGGLSSPNFSQYIANKYSGLKLGKFQFATLTLLKKNSQNSIENVTQILKNEVINAGGNSTELKFDLNLFLFWNQAVQRLLGEKSKYQFQKFLTVNLNLLETTSVKIARTWQLQTHKLESMGLEQRWFKQSFLLLRSSSNFNQFNQRVESKQKSNFTNDTRGLNKEVIRDVTQNLTYQLLRKTQNIIPRKLSINNLGLFDANQVNIARIWQLKTHKLVNMGLEQRWLKQTSLLFPSSSNFNHFNQRVESKHKSNLANDTKGFNAEIIRDVTQNLTYQFLNKARNINPQQQANEILHGEKKNNQYHKWLIKNLTFFKSNSILINRTSQLQNYQLKNNVIDEYDNLVATLTVNQLEKSHVNLLLPRHNLDIRLLSATYENFIYTRKASALIDEIKSKQKDFTLLSSSSSSYTQLQLLINYKKEKEYAEIENYPFQMLCLKPDLSRFADKKVNQLKSREFNEFENESENLISRQNTQVREDLSNENTDLKLQLISTNISTVNTTGMLISTAYERNFNLISKLQNIDTQSILQHRNNANNFEILSFAPHQIRTKQWKQTSETIISQQTDNNRLENQQYQRHQLYSNTPELELIKSQAKVSPISNQDERKNESKNAIKDDIKQNKNNSSVANIDMNLLTNQIFQRLEQKIKIERQRRGIL